MEYGLGVGGARFVGEDQMGGLELCHGKRVAGCCCRAEEEKSELEEAACDVVAAAFVVQFARPGGPDVEDAGS